ncbi:MAG: fasciclin domain-containing protein [Halieaceae bacterium]|uniref:fasciclin domain-containing protein n=1 Tax=Haliea alexandrii TaxID=2448162 RepID=UPI001E3F1F7D|nr:fasciclin domain-containing protein [Haliea alexandrii]MCR9184502.1 fasciclin domain-containing protein [Halieaceae bacterium]
MRLISKLMSLAALSGMLLASSVATADGHAHAEEMAKPTIVEIAVSNPDFSTLVAALKAAGLVEALSGEGPFTVFAPTNAAFAALPEGTLDDLLKPENKETLSAVLTYHVVAGKVMAADVVTLTEATSLQGDTIMVTASDAGVKVDAANVTATDIEAANGVIHVIDAVILPNS